MGSFGTALVLGLLVPGCFAPLRTRAIPAPQMPDSFRIPERTAGERLNFSHLAMPAPEDYILGPRDVLAITVDRLYNDQNVEPIRAQVMSNGEIRLPLVGPVKIGGLNLVEAHDAIERAFVAGDLLKEPRVNVAILEKASTSVVVLGEVNKPGTYPLPKYENDIAHALAAAGGLTDDAGGYIEVHRRSARNLATGSLEGVLFPVDVQSEEGGPVKLFCQDAILRIPFYGSPPGGLPPEDIVLQPDDVVVVPSRKNNVFYVVGPLAATNFVRFNIGARERDLGTGFLLPRDREVDVVTAVVMAGFIDPIASPTTVTVHRRMEDGTSLLVKVDLIKARYNPDENIIVEAGDIIYLNPDIAWWYRRLFDRIVDLVLIDFFRLSYSKSLSLP